MTFPEELLSDPVALAAADAGGVLRRVAAGPAHVREAALAIGEASLPDIGDRVRSVLLTAAGVAGLAAAAVAALVSTDRVPVLRQPEGPLPGWVGATDAVVALGATGREPGPLAVAAEALRRGVPLFVAAPVASPLAELGERGRGTLVALPGRIAAEIWATTTAGLLLTEAVTGVASASEPAEVLAQSLEAVAAQCRPDAEPLVNPAKSLALALAGRLPVLVGTDRAGRALAERFAAFLGGVAAVPAVSCGADDYRLGLLAGPAAAPDVFADEPGGAHLLLLATDPASSASAIADRAAANGVPTTQLQATGAGPAQRFASLAGLLDFAAVYQALAGRVADQEVRWLPAGGPGSPG